MVENSQAFNASIIFERNEYNLNKNNNNNCFLKYTYEPGSSWFFVWTRVLPPGHD